MKSPVAAHPCFPLARRASAPCARTPPPIAPSAGPLRPWLGVFAEERGDGRVVVQSLAADGPALQAGIEPGDVIVAAGDLRVDGLADFYRKLWNGRGPGDPVTLTVERGGESRSIEVLGGNRYRWLRLGPDF